MRHPPHRRSAGLVAALAGVVVLASACSGVVQQEDVARANGQIRGVQVSGRPGTLPQVRIDAPLKVDRTATQTVVQGSGQPVYLDRTFLLDLTMYDARTGKKAVSTYDRGQHPIAVTDTGSTLFPVLTRALVGKTQGSRVVVAARTEDAYGDTGAAQYGIRPGDPLVMVADIVAVPPTTVLTGPRGVHRRAPHSLPRVLTEDATPTGLAFSAAHLVRPRDLVVVPLIEGTGPRVGAHSLVALNYLGQIWEGRVFANTYAKEPVIVPIGVNRVVKAWDRALRGVTRGSRLLVIAPPRLAFKDRGSPPEIPGNATLAYVIDVLGVS